MSVDICIFLDPGKLPTHKQWQRAIQDAGHSFEFDDFSPREHTGFLPVRLNGRKCGFEYYFAAMEEEDEDVLEIAGDRTHVVTFVLHGGQLLDLEAAEIAGSVLADIANGVFFDPQSGDHATGKGAYHLLADAKRAEHERKQAQAERKWAKITERRCPECNSPCPEYRGDCWVCGFAIGKGSARDQTQHLSESDPTPVTPPARRKPWWRFW